MVAPFLFLLAAVTIRQDNTPVREGCEPDDLKIVSLPGGAVVEVRFALAGSATPCYKIAAGSVTGFVQAGDLAGLEEFDKTRREAASSTVSVKVTTVEINTVQKRASAALESDRGLGGTVKLLEANQPAAALASLEPALTGRPPDSNTLNLAGIAAWRNDEVRKALEYWKQSLELRADSQLEALYKKVQREASADHSGQRSTGMRVNLRYEGANVTPELAREMLDVLDHEYAMISDRLGCRAEERITAIVQSREAYIKSTGAAEWSGGQYDGRIRIALADERAVGPDTRRRFAHELVHACLSSLGHFPAWFQEGMAQKLSGDQLSAGTAQSLDGKARDGTLPRLSELGQSWSRMNGENAAVAYALALRAADLLPGDLRSLVRDPEAISRIAQDIDRKLRAP